MRARIIIILLLFPLIFIWTIGWTLMSVGERNQSQKRQAEASPELTTCFPEEEPEATAEA